MSSTATFWDEFGPWIANHLWQSTLFALVALLAAALIRKNPARVRSAILSVASLKFLVPFSLLTAIADGLRTPGPQMVTPQIIVALEPVVRPFEQAPPFPALSSPGGGWNLMPWVLFSLWFLGFAAVVLAWNRRRRRLHITLKGAVRAGSGAELETLRRFERKASVRRPVRLLLSGSGVEPGVTGILRSTLILPAGISKQLARTEVESVVAHELCHVARRDNLRAVIHKSVEALFWFHPLVWWLGALQIRERERACDEAVVSRWGFDPRVYGSAILKVCEMYVPSSSWSYAGVSRSGLERRIEEILTAHRVRCLTVWRKLWLSAVLVTALVAPVAVSLTDASPNLNPPLAQFNDELGTRTVSSIPGQIEAVAALSSPEAVEPSTPAPFPQPIQQEAIPADDLEERLRSWLEQDVTYIITDEERAAFRALETDEERLQFQEQFWLRRDPTPATLENEFRVGQFRRIEEANAQFSYGDIPGWQTDRGRIYILYGEPESREAYPNGGLYERSPAEGGGTTLTFPFERWRYSLIQGIGREVVFEFVDTDLSGEYRLATSPSEKEAVER